MPNRLPLWQFRQALYQLLNDAEEGSGFVMRRDNDEADFPYLDLASTDLTDPDDADTHNIFDVSAVILAFAHEEDGGGKIVNDMLESACEVLTSSPLTLEGFRATGAFRIRARVDRLSDHSRRMYYRGTLTISYKIIQTS